MSLLCGPGHQGSGHPRRSLSARPYPPLFRPEHPLTLRPLPSSSPGPAGVAPREETGAGSPTSSGVAPRNAPIPGRPGLQPRERPAVASPVALATSKRPREGSWEVRSLSDAGTKLKALAEAAGLPALSLSFSASRCGSGRVSRELRGGPTSLRRCTAEDSGRDPRCAPVRALTPGNDPLFLRLAVAPCGAGPEGLGLPQAAAWSLRTF